MLLGGALFCSFVGMVRSRMQSKISLIKSLLWEKFIASRYIVSKSRDSFLPVIAIFSFLGICIGVATLIIVMSVMGGFREELLNRILGMKGHAVVYGYTGDIADNNDDTIQKIQQCRGVTSVCPMIERQAIVSAQEQSRGAMIIAMRPEYLQTRGIICDSLCLKPGLSIHDFSGDCVIIGKRMAEIMSLHIGDSIAVVNLQGEVTPFGPVPKQQDFEIVGTFEVGMTEYDKSVVIMPLPTAQLFFDLQERLTQIEIFTENIEKNGKIIGDIKQAVENTRCYIVGWQHGDSHLFQAMRIERNVMFLILILIVLIASFNIISGLVMLVKDKTKDIAIMKTMGASQASILRIFLMAGSTIGIVGTIFGTLAGVFITMRLDAIVAFLQNLFNVQIFNPEVYFLTTIPTRLNYSEVLLIGGLSVVISFLATIYPSLRAARLNPAEALRSDA
ncbi:MAG: lipoprotein-releasing ABC transporter permease subunit [Holosporales bacterium]|nr:lipoprotein-releasing ABC transporter permease subunit [Holosporales bacterium]